MAEWQNDTELVRLAQRDLYSAVVGDIMDKLGLLHQFLPPQVHPLRADMFVIGRAMPALECDWKEGDANTPAGPPPDQPFGLMLKALDDLKPNEVYVCGGGSAAYAQWGELMSAAAQRRGAVGAVIAGYSRDTRGICALDFRLLSRICG